MHILVADDDDLSCVLLRELLRTLGHDCATVTDGADAWEHLVAHGADVVISDWQMPGLSGVELCRQVRAHPEIAYPYFILLTGRVDPVDVVTSQLAGADDYLAKPLDIAQLEARLIVAQGVLEMLRSRHSLVPGTDPDPTRTSSTSTGGSSAPGASPTSPSSPSTPP